MDKPPPQLTQRAMYGDLEVGKPIYRPKMDVHVPTPLLVVLFLCHHNVSHITPRLSLVSRVGRLSAGRCHSLRTSHISDLFCLRKEFRISSCVQTPCTPHKVSQRYRRGKTHPSSWQDAHDNNGMWYS